LSAFEFQAMVGREVAVDSARNYRRLRTGGVSVRKTIDVLIGHIASKAAINFCTLIATLIRWSVIWVCASCECENIFDAVVRGQ
jgi:hypothetical protein